MNTSWRTYAALCSLLCVAPVGCAVCDSVKALSSEQIIIHPASAQTGTLTVTEPGGQISVYEWGCTAGAQCLSPDDSGALFLLLSGVAGSYSIVADANGYASARATFVTTPNEGQCAQGVRASPDPLTLELVAQD